MNKSELHLTIVSPERTLFDGPIAWVDLPGEMGRFQVLINHAPLISSLVAGNITYQTGDEKFRVKRDVQTLPISGGFIEIKHNHVTVCVEE